MRWKKKIELLKKIAAFRCRIDTSRIHEILPAAHLVTRVIVIITAMTFCGNDLAEAAGSGTRAGDDDNDNVTERERYSNAGDQRILENAFWAADCGKDPVDCATRSQGDSEVCSRISKRITKPWCDAISVAVWKHYVSHNALAFAVCYKFIPDDDTRYITTGCSARR